MNIQSEMWAVVGGTSMTVAQDDKGEWRLHVGDVATVPVAKLDRTGVILVGEWINLASPTVDTVWAIINATAAHLRSTLLAKIDAERIER